jgi:endonuclease/exonuclease/phosphatase family metal-dependent hydrolase
MNMNNKNTTEEQYKIKIAALNCRGLKKTNKKQKRQQFIRFLRLLGCDILLLQETMLLIQKSSISSICNIKLNPQFR